MVTKRSPGCDLLSVGRRGECGGAAGPAGMAGSRDLQRLGPVSLCHRWRGSVAVVIVSLPPPAFLQ